MDGQTINLDALVVGAGFGGVYQLMKLRKEGFSVKLVERGSDYGGVWYWNRYPGARVDSSTPHYEFSDPDLWQNWKWKQRFPGSVELRAYFNFVAEEWDLQKDTMFNVAVASAKWDDAQSVWMVATENGPNFRVKFLLLNTGFAAKRYTPDWKGIDTFQGTWVHPSFWPKQDPDLQGKKVALIGTGATGIQLAQDLAKIVGELTVFQRTPNTALPMRQEEYSGIEQAIPRHKYPGLFEGRQESFGGFDFNFAGKATFDDTPEEREAFYESLYKEGDFHFWLATYYDMLFSEDANLEAYKFWREKTRARINNPRLQEILAPTNPPHPFGCKRVSMENGYYEIFNQANVKLVDMNTEPVREVTPKGIKTSEGEHEFDMVVCATGFDAVTGGLVSIDVQGRSGQTLKDKWKDGAATYLGMAVHDYPNMFFTYGPQAPTALCNGPTCAELQGEWIAGVLKYMRGHGKAKIEANAAEQEEWDKVIWKLANASLLPKAKSWYMGDNIPGKPRQPLIYLGGVPTYYKTINEVADSGYKGFTLC